MTSARVTRHFGVLAFLFLIANTNNVFCEETQPPSEHDPKAEAVMRGLSDYFGPASSFSVNVNLTSTMQARGVKNAKTNTYEIAVEKPNKISMIGKPAASSAIVVCDGTNLSICVPSMHKYVVKPAPADFDALIEADEIGLTSTGNMIFVTSFIASKPYDKIMKEVRSSKYVGEEDLDGKKYHHLSFSQNDYDWDLWVTVGENPLPLKLVPDLSRMMERAGHQPGMADMKVETEVTFTDWAVGQSVPPERFKFEPPADAKKVDSFFEGRGEEQPHELLGKAVPAFELDLLDGGKLNPADHKGKNIVILDFWATWCGPCRAAMPVLIEVAESYKDKGVVFYAVNEDEGPDTIREYLKEVKLKCTVALDTGTTVGHLFKVEGIPTTFVIGKEGNIEVVHVGYMPDLKERLSGELDAILQGKKPSEDKRKSDSGKTETETKATKESKSNL